MMKRIGLLIILICIVILPACSNSKPEDIDKETDKTISDLPEESNNPQEEDKNSETNKTISDLPEGSEGLQEEIETIFVDLSTEEGIKDYLVGEWTFDNEHISQATCKMNIDKDLNLKLSFDNTYTDDLKDDYQGKIILDRQYARPNEVADLIMIELNDDDWPGGEYFFLHRSNYDGKYLMSLFFAGNGNGIFDMLGDIDNFEYAPEEIFFEKISGQTSKLGLHKNKEFHAVFWGKGDKEEEFWLDDVLWTPIEEYDPDQKYPDGMINYENSVKESVIYSLLEDNSEHILMGQNFFQGDVYYVRTDEEGKIIEIEDAQHKEYLDIINEPDFYFEEGSEDYIDPEFADLIFGFLTNVAEVEEYLDSGMSILFTGETITIDGEECYLVFLGTNLEEAFVREIHYAVNTSTGQVYHYDVLNDTWEYMSLD